MMRLSFNEEEVERAMNLYRVFARAFKKIKLFTIFCLLKVKAQTPR